MAETYQHGIYIKELATILTPPVEVAAPIVCVGTSAMFNATKPANPNEPILCSSLAEYVEQFGWSGDFDKYTNEEAASAAFQLFNISPVIFINVLDTTVHSAQANKVITGLSNPVTIEEPIILNTIQITSGSGSAAVTLTADEFTARFDDDKCVITITDDDRIVNDTAQLSYKKINPAAVTGADIIGGVDPTTGKNNGLDTVEDVYSKLGLLPGSLRESASFANSHLLGNLGYIAGLFAAIGHNFPVFFGFKGGKGVATGIGVIFALNPAIGAIVLVVAVSIMAITRIVSLGSIIGAALFPLLLLAFGLGKGSFSVVSIVIASLLAILVILRHHSNIKRLINGTENKLFEKK